MGINGRYYLGKKVGNSTYAEFGAAWQNAAGGSTLRTKLIGSGTNFESNITSKLNVIQFNLTVGWQFRLSNRIYLDWCFVGGSINIANIGVQALSDNFGLSTSEQNEVYTNLAGSIFGRLTGLIPTISNTRIIFDYNTLYFLPKGNLKLCFWL